MELIRKVFRKMRSVYKGFQETQRFKRNLAAIKRDAAASPAPRKYIIDCGFNQGIVAGRLLESLADFSLVGFEVQQDIQNFADSLKQKFPERSIEVNYSAISNKDGTIEYFEPSKWGKNYKGGTTTIGNKKSMGIKYDTPLVAPSIDFAKWLEENFTREDYLFVKMDIEGAEYDVIEHLLDTGSIDMVDVIAVEWHAEKFPEPSRSRFIGIENNLKKYSKTHPLQVLDWY